MPQEVAIPCFLFRSFHRSGGGDLHATDRVEARLAVEFQPRIAPDAVAREVGHRLRRIGLEDEPRRMRGRPARLEQRPLIQDHHVPPAEIGEMRRGAAADDAGPDEHNPSRIFHR
jgi:hypothetical protein